MPDAPGDKQPILAYSPGSSGRAGLVRVLAEHDAFLCEPEKPATSAALFTPPRFR